MFDLDPQMTLTQAVALYEDGKRTQEFGNWYQNSVDSKKTIFDALGDFAKPNQHFDFGYDFIYQVSDRLHCVPAVEALYWQEQELSERQEVQDFIGDLLEKIATSPKLARYDYVLFDSPPMFTKLLGSVLRSCDLILIPVNPDFFSSRGVSHMLRSLEARIETHPLPRIGVFMNRAKTVAQKLTNQASSYMKEIEAVCSETAREEKINVRFFQSYIPERLSIREAISGGGVPTELSDFRDLWTEIEVFLNEEHNLPNMPGSVKARRLIDEFRSANSK